jgi:hypothetical protein
MKCQECGIKQALYGIEYKKPTRCRNHKSDGMVDVTSKRCLEPECTTRPIYGVEYKKATHCINHKSDSMVDVSHARCLEPDCTTRPIYGVEWNKATHCKDHKSDSMMNVVSKRCLEPNCTKIPTFGLVKSKATHCSTHKSNAMMNVINKHCLEPDCTTRPTYGVEWNKATHCGNHKSDDMMNVTAKRCLEPNCTKQPSYGLEYKKPTHCSNHKSNGMLNVNHKRCLELGCTKNPNFGLIQSVPIYCIDHKSNKMINVTAKRCSTCNATTMNKKYKPNCSRCHFYLNPNDPRLTNYKVKEHAFMQPLTEIYSNIILDKIISGGCSRRRPDGFIDCLTHSIIIEIDEDQHVGYESLCDNRRTMELFQDLGERPIIFIRFNPDSYKIDGKIIKGCFTQSKSGGLEVVKKEFSKRFTALQESIEFAIQDGMPSKEINSIKLFYSE